VEIDLALVGDGRGGGEEGVGLIRERGKLVQHVANVLADSQELSMGSSGYCIGSGASRAMCGSSDHVLLGNGRPKLEGVFAVGTAVGLGCRQQI
jgi:hypothetical protein